MKRWLPLLLIVIAATAYGARGEIRDALEQATRDPLPPAQTLEEVAAPATEDKSDRTNETNRSTREVEPVPEPTPEPTPPPAEPKNLTASPSNLLPVSIPASINLAVPFTSQAPHANWEQPYQDACEEASLYMVKLFYDGRQESQIAVDEADLELQRLFEAERALFGSDKDATAAQVAILAEQQYGFERIEVLSRPSVEDLKAHLAAGRPVIIPAAGRLLGNPFFRAPGPLYHMLVLRGYTDTTFITNDPGTRRGRAYTYSYATIMNAMHDWNGGDVEHGESLAVVVYPL